MLQNELSLTEVEEENMKYVDKEEQELIDQKNQMNDENNLEVS